MKIFIGPYKNFWGPHHIAEKIIFWNEDLAKKFGDWMSYKDNKHTHTWFRDFTEWVATKRKRKVKIKIHNYDSWNADTTLAMVILPVLKELQRTKQGSGFVDDEYVPDELKSTSAPPKENEWDSDANLHKRWDWVLSEIIWSFEQLQPDYDWEEQYCKTVPLTEEDKGTIWAKLGEKTGTKPEYDRDGMVKHQERINNGLLLFGRFYENLWS